MMLALYALLSVIMRSTGIIMYFAPDLGLFNLLRHLQGSQNYLERIQKNLNFLDATRVIDQNLQLINSFFLQTFLLIF